MSLTFFFHPETAADYLFLPIKGQFDDQRNALGEACSGTASLIYSQIKTSQKSNI